MMSPETVVFFLGEPFRWPLLGDDDGNENDEDSVINDLEFHLSNYEADWDGGGRAATPLEHWGWEHLRRVLWVKRNSARVRDEVEEQRAAGDIELAVYLPAGIPEESAVWIVKTLMRPAAAPAGN